MHITIFRTLYKNVTENQRIERLLSRHGISFEKTTYEKGSRYKIASDTEESINIFKKHLGMIYPQITF